MSKQPTTGTQPTTTAAATKETTQEPSSGDSKFDALQKALKEKGIASGQFMSGDEGWRKRALKEDYQQFKEKHQWIYDQPITPKTKEDQEAEGKVKA